ncbi:hypothetical protein GWE18_33465 [Bradyrhizobium sp. CSA112]|uniref:hypothetical protein n=1 Tax=Bradyrhizobium sp. CSA112 TaxID=2699170 RepID=UPI0023AFD1AA|nr:hypothetical protein [Bradyrhizobium sp. CSA112]MDE5457638.1 hypothetical protein [Bradyrhizobium sp. CSA112]
MVQFKQHWPIAILVLIAGISSAIFVFIWGRKFGVCPIVEVTDLQLKTIATLTDIVDLGLKLSTALVGFGAAALVGIKTEVKLSRFMRVMLVTSILFFAQSALYGVWWRFGIAQMYLNECLSLITASALQWRFQAHVYLFMFGMCAVGILVLGAMFRETKKPEYDT